MVLVLPPTSYAQLYRAGASMALLYKTMPGKLLLRLPTPNFNYLTTFVDGNHNFEWPFQISLQNHLFSSFVRPSLLFIDLETWYVSE